MMSSLVYYVEDTDLGEKYQDAGGRCPFCYTTTLEDGPLVSVGVLKQCRSCGKELLIVPLFSPLVQQTAAPPSIAIVTRMPGEAARLYASPSDARLPIPLTCQYCGEVCLDTDIDGHRFLIGSNPLIHTACLIRSLCGSVAHQRGTCPCCGGTDHDDETLTVRQAALAARAEFLRNLGKNSS